MFAINPFAAVAVPSTFLQGYVVLMIVLVVAGTLFDILHKGSAKYFFASWRRSKTRSRQPLGGGELAAIAVKTAVVDVLASGEFCNVRRRIAHLLGMYGFVLYLVSTVVMVFDAAPATIWPELWWLGGLMVCVGGYWFWFFIRVDVAAEGNSPFRVVQADLFVLSLVISTTLGLLWAFLQAQGVPAARVFFALYLLATTVLFGSVPWSKFAHMFFKPAAAFEKRVSQADGTRSNLPAPADKPEQFGSRVKHARNY
jgi:hypothetical protein